MKQANTATMTAMLPDGPHQPLRLARIPIPRPREHDVLIRVSACGVCRTDLHILDGAGRSPVACHSRKRNCRYGHRNIEKGRDDLIDRIERTVLASVDFFPLPHVAGLYGLPKLRLEFGALGSRL